MTLDEERAAAALPTVIVSDTAFAQDLLDNWGGDWFPPGADETFKTLWGV